MEKVTITFSKDKETKGTFRYKEDDTPNHSPIMGSAYLQKWYTGRTDKEAPAKIQISIEEVK